MGVLMIRALLFGCLSEPPLFANSKLGTKRPYEHENPTNDGVWIPHCFGPLNQDVGSLCLYGLRDPPNNQDPKLRCNCESVK